MISQAEKKSHFAASRTSRGSRFNVLFQKVKRWSISVGFKCNPDGGLHLLTDATGSIQSGLWKSKLVFAS